MICAWSLEWFAAADRVEVLSMATVTVAVIVVVGSAVGVGVAALCVAGGHEGLLGRRVGAEAQVRPAEGRGALGTIHEGRPH